MYIYIRIYVHAHCVNPNITDHQKQLYTDAQIIHIMSVRRELGSRYVHPASALQPILCSTPYPSFSEFGTNQRPCTLHTHVLLSSPPGACFTVWTRHHGHQPCKPVQTTPPRTQHIVHQNRFCMHGHSPPRLQSAIVSTREGVQPSTCLNLVLGPGDHEHLAISPLSASRAAPSA